MSKSVTQQTIGLIQKAMGEGDIAKANTITTATGLTAYDLQAPSKNLYPVNTPLRNSLARVGGRGGTATNWKQVRPITGSGLSQIGWVAEGQRTTVMSMTVEDKAASYKTLGEEAASTFEAVAAGQGFEDVRAKQTMRLMQQLMLKEENALLGGNLSMDLGTPATPSLSAAGSGATLPAATYSVIVVALTFEGYIQAVANGTPLSVSTSTTVTGQDGNTYTLKGGSSNKSSAATQAVTLGQTLSCSVTAIRGAVGYAWYVGTAGNEKLEKLTTVNSATFASALAGTGQAATAVTADNSKNTLGFDGLLYAAYQTSSGAYFKSLATGTPGTGTTLSASGEGGVTEIDEMLYTMWNDNQVSPSVIWVNAQELKNIKAKALAASGGASLASWSLEDRGGNGIIANAGFPTAYVNPYTTESSINIPLRLHPKLPPGTIFAPCLDLPVQYQSNEVPNTAEVVTRQDYYQIDWPQRTRAHETGVYVDEVLATYAPFAMGIITNISDG